MRTNSSGSDGQALRVLLAQLMLVGNPGSADLVLNSLITGAKYRGESQNWGSKYDEIINKRRFHKGF